MNSVFVDFELKSDWKFTKELESITAEKWEAVECRTNQYHGSRLATLIRFFWYFLFPLKMVLQRSKWYKIIAWQQFYGLNFAFWSRLLHLKKKNNLTVMTFIYKRKSGIVGDLYHKYMLFIVRSEYIDKFICFSKEECEYYPVLFGVSKDSFVYLPVGIEPLDSFETKDEGYIFATGRSNRDYGFLVKVLQGTDYECQIACDTIPSGVTMRGIIILSDCHGVEMIRLMAKSHCVVIPLKDTRVSSGQLVLLQAMALGKPVICTDADGIRDYTSTDTTIMIPNDEGRWKEALHLLYRNKDLYTTLSSSSYNRFKKNFTDIVMYRNIANIINTDKYEKDN